MGGDRGDIQSVSKLNRCVAMGDRKLWVATRKSLLPGKQQFHLFIREEICYHADTVLLLT